MHKSVDIEAFVHQRSAWATNMARDVFISYSSKDKTAADAVCVAVENAQIRCWIAPRDISPGADWSTSIMEAIGNSRVLLLVFSGNANTSRYVQREVQVACDQGLTVIPFRIENVLPTGGMKFYLGTVHCLDALTPSVDSHHARLIRAIKALLFVVAEPAETGNPAPIGRDLEPKEIPSVGAPSRALRHNDGNVASNPKKMFSLLTHRTLSRKYWLVISAMLLGMFGLVFAYVWKNYRAMSPDTSTTPPPIVTSQTVPTLDQETRYRELLSEVRKAVSAGHTAEAIGGYVELISNYPGHTQSVASLEALLNGLKTTGPRPGDADAALLSSMERAANIGSATAMIFLGERVLETDPPAAAAWYRKAADLERPEAMVMLGDLYFRGKGVRQDAPQAVRWYQLASDKGSARAKVYLAEFYENGQGGLPQDLKRVFALLKEADAIEPGNPATAEKLALAYEHGWGTSADPKLAFEWMKKAADSGFANALGNLGCYYMRGFGTRTDVNAAAALFKQGAEKKSATCQFFYAQCLEQGIGGTTVNRSAAMELYRDSARQGFAPAKQWCAQHKVDFETKH